MMMHASANRIFTSRALVLEPRPHDAGSRRFATRQEAWDAFGGMQLIWLVPDETAHVYNPLLIMFRDDAERDLADGGTLRQAAKNWLQLRDEDFDGAAKAHIDHARRVWNRIVEVFA